MIKPCKCGKKRKLHITKECGSCKCNLCNPEQVMIKEPHKVYPLCQHKDASSGKKFTFSSYSDYKYCPLCGEKLQLLYQNPSHMQYRVIKNE